jgi:hypothetical protein
MFAPFNIFGIPDSTDNLSPQVRRIVNSLKKLKIVIAQTHKKI